MLDSEVLKQVRAIQLRTTRLLKQGLAGEYKSVFKGQGMEFAEVRQYIAGDDVRSIDWNVTARTGEAYIKRFEEEREQTVMFLVDLSGSGSFGSVAKTKNTVAAEMCALLAFSAIRNNDKVGMIIFTNQIEHYLPPDKGRKHVLRLIRDILTFEPKNNGTDIALALEHLNKVIRRHALTFVVSDFLQEQSDFEKALKSTAKRHELTAIRLNDIRERKLPNVGLIRLQSAESGETYLIDSSSKYVRQEFAKRATLREQQLQMLFHRCKIDYVDIKTEEDMLEPLIKFFRRREAKCKM